MQSLQINRDYEVKRRHYINKRFHVLCGSNQYMKSIDLCHILDKPVNTSKMEQKTFTCSHCKCTTTTQKKIVCYLDKRHNQTSFLCNKCNERYQRNKENYFQSKCFVCNQQHSYPKNWKECCVCSEKKKETFDLHCPKSDKMEYNKKTRKSFIVRHMCKDCSGKWNIREKNCPFCRQNHFWDKNALKHFKIVRILPKVNFMPMFIQELNGIVGQEMASAIFGDWAFE